MRDALIYELKNETIMIIVIIKRLFEKLSFL